MTKMIANQSCQFLDRRIFSTGRISRLQKYHRRQNGAEKSIAADALTDLLQVQFDSGFFAIDEAGFGFKELHCD